MNEPDHHYLVSLPENIPAGQNYPLIVAIDPHGDGNLAVGIFTEALFDINAVIAGSEKLKNNYPYFEPSLSNLIQDLITKYPVDPDRIILAGFSGGARMAYYYGSKHKSLGVTMFGAGPGRNFSPGIGPRVYAVSGTRDFNFMEQYIRPLTLYKDDSGNLSDPQYVCDFFRGTHEWPPLLNIYESVVWVLQDDPGLPGNVPEGIAGRELLRYDSLLETGDLFFAGLALQKAWIFSSGKDRNRISGMSAKLGKTPGWEANISNFEGYLQKETRLKQAYAARLSDPDTNWWKKEILILDENIMSCTDPVKEDFFYRIKGFIGIILYSQINSIIQSGQHTGTLDRLMVIYELAEPESEDLIKFRKQLELMPAGK